MTIHSFDKSQQFSSNPVPDFRPENSIMNPQHAIYDHNNPDIAQAEAYALETLRIAGAWVTVIPRTEDNKFDKTWNEDSSPTYYEGYDFKAFFAPDAPKTTLTKFGHDAPNNFDLMFSRAELLNSLGERLIRTGDVIIIPHNSLIINANRFKVLHSQDYGNYKYRWLYIACTVENMNKDESLVPRNI